MRKLMLLSLSFVAFAFAGCVEPVAEPEEAAVEQLLEPAPACEVPLVYSTEAVGLCGSCQIFGRKGYQIATCPKTGESARVANICIKSCDLGPD